jgi:hypothetical protein
MHMRHHIRQIRRPCIRMPTHFQNNTTRRHHENTGNNTTTITRINQQNKHSLRRRHRTNRTHPRRTHQATSRYHDPSHASNEANEPTSSKIAASRHHNTHPSSLRVTTRKPCIICRHITPRIREDKYYQGRTTSSATQTDTIATITERNYALIPFTIDQLGRLGYTAHEFLGMPETYFPPTKPP